MPLDKGEKSIVTDYGLEAMDHLYGAVPPVAANVPPVYFALTTPSGRLIVVIVSGGGGMIVKLASAALLSASFALNALTLSVTELVMVRAVFLYCGDLLVGALPSVV